MTLYEMLKYWLIDTLETYRDTPKDKPKRKFIDRLTEISRQATVLSEEDKRYHNLIVLQYITDKAIPKSKICEALHIGRNTENYNKITENAINRLLVLVFGVDGINWY